MPRPKSLLPKLEIDVVCRAHNCQHNSRHHLQKGDKRLKVTEGRSVEHFCINCALDMIKRDIFTLNSISDKLQR